jgi:hypothetical protein
MPPVACVGEAGHAAKSALAFSTSEPRTSFVEIDEAAPAPGIELADCCGLTAGMLMVCAEAKSLGTCKGDVGWGAVTTRCGVTAVCMLASKPPAASPKLLASGLYSELTASRVSNRSSVKAREPVRRKRARRLRQINLGNQELR